MFPNEKNYNSFGHCCFCVAAQQLYKLTTVNQRHCVHWRFVSVHYVVDFTFFSHPETEHLKSCSGKFDFVLNYKLENCKNVGNWKIGWDYDFRKIEH